MPSAGTEGLAWYGRGREEGGAAYKGQAPEDHSLLYSLMNARRKDDGQPLSDLHICAQAFTFVLAGECIRNLLSSTLLHAQMPMHA